tara:strand:+ start:4758 stop:5765 length:1008 start_codon:yes stop_codon:yes gene_type:complete
MAIRTSISNSLRKLANGILRIAHWFNTDPKIDEFQQRLHKWEKLWFVVDIPLFIDSQSVNKLYDALSRPEFETVSRTQGSSRQNSKHNSFQMSGKAGLELAPFLTTSMNTKFGHKETNSHTESASFNQEANRSPEMQFEKVIGFYKQNYPKRIFWVGENLSQIMDIDGKLYTWDEISKEIAVAAPRPLIIFELEKGSKIIPMAGETVDSMFKPIYKSYIAQLDNSDDFPEYKSEDDPESDRYWKALEESFDSAKAMREVENATKSGGRLDWIDYRLLSIEENEILPIHLHLAPKGNYNTGTFAYQTVRRGSKFGLKIVGTLKQGRDVNVLAMYEN